MITKSLQSVWRDLGHYKYFRALSIAGVAVLVATIGYLGHTWRVHSREETAQKLFAECQALYEQALAGESKKDTAKQNALWHEVAVMCEQAYQRVSSSYIAPFFLAYQAEALIHQDKAREAIEVMDKMVGKYTMGMTVELYDMYKTKRALMKLDMSDKDTQEQGLKELQALAADPISGGNAAQDQALYYLGQYYWSINEPEKAREAWKKLKEIGSTPDKNFTSPWLDALQEKIDIA